MIGSRREEHRSDLEAIADDVRSWLRGEDSANAEAGGLFVADLLHRWRRSMTSEG